MSHPTYNRIILSVKNAFTVDNCHSRGGEKYFVIYRPTLAVDGEIIIERGHLTALEDTKLHAIAAKYGDPDALLKQQWSPDQDPRYR